MEEENATTGKIETETGIEINTRIEIGDTADVGIATETKKGAGAEAAVHANVSEVVVAAGVGVIVHANVSKSTAGVEAGVKRGKEGTEEAEKKGRLRGLEKAKVAVMRLSLSPQIILLLHRRKLTSRLMDPSEKANLTTTMKAKQSV